LADTIRSEVAFKSNQKHATIQKYLQVDHFSRDEQEMLRKRNSTNINL